MQRSVYHVLLLLAMLLPVGVAPAQGETGLRFYTPDPAPRPRVLMDYYHHAKPQTEIGNLMVTGDWATNLGRYGINDFHHPNGFDSPIQALEEEFALVLHEKPFTAETLAGADIVWIFTPDSKELSPDAILISDQEIDALESFVRAGGSLVLMVNSHHKTEKFDHVQFKKLFRRFGLDWNKDDTKYVDIRVGPSHPYFYDIDIFHYGAGCTLEYLPSDLKRRTLLHVHGDVGDEHVQGPGISLVRCGEGKVMACGDTGSWGGNMCRPWAENHRFLVQMFRWAKRDTGIRPPAYRPGQQFKYRMTTARAVVMPRWNSLNNLAQPDFKLFVPREKTRVPYLESYADVQLTCTGFNDSGVKGFAVRVANWKRFDEPVKNAVDQPVEMKTNRQGAMIRVTSPKGPLQKLAPDLPHLLAFIPNDGVRVGDRWNKILRLPINPVRGVDPAPVRPVQTEMCYVRDEEVHGRPCRLIMTSGVEWLSELGISIEDLLPEDEVDRWAGPHYKFFAPRGGRFEFKREQWIDRETGIVVRARIQSRFVAWIRDLNKPVGKTKADIDNNMVTLSSQDTIFELQ